MPRIMKIIAAYAVSTASVAIFAQSLPTPQPAPAANLLQLSTSATVEVAQDWLTLTLSTTKEAADAAGVQAQLTQALDAALAQARRQAQPGQLEVRTGPFGLYPRYGKDGKINGWQGRAELVLAGRDFARITGTAGQIQTLSVSAVGFSLAPESRTKAENEAQAQAVARFQERAATLAQAFGFGGYTLRSVAVSTSGQYPTPQPRMLTMAAKAGALEDAAVPVEAGKAQVSAQVSGEVQMR